MARFLKSAYTRHLVPLGLFMVLGALISVHLKQDQSWDLLNYHYYNGYALLNHRSGIDIAAAGAQTYWNPLFEVVPYILRSLPPIIGGGVILGAIQSLNAFLIFEIFLVLARKFLQGWRLYTTALIVSVISFGASVNLGELGTAMGDNTTATLILTSVIIQLIMLQSPNWSKTRRLTWKLFSYVLIGSAVAVKLTNAPYAIGLLITEPFYTKGIRALLKQSLLNISGLAIGYLIAGGFWIYYLWTTFKSPLFPLYNGIFHSPYYAYHNVPIMVTSFYPHDLTQWLFYPFYFIHTQSLISEVNFRDPRLAVLYIIIVLLGMLMLVRRYSTKLDKVQPPKELLMLIVFLITSYAVWELELSNIRYLIPVFLLAVPVIFVTLVVILGNRLLGMSVGLICILIIALTTTSMSWGRIPWQSTWFGVHITEGAVNVNSTVLTAGDEPLSFIAPALPKGTALIHISSILSVPANGNTPMQRLLRQRVAARQASGSSMYAITTRAGLAYETAAFNAYGFKLSKCYPIETYSDTFSGQPGYHQICHLMATLSKN